MESATENHTDEPMHAEASVDISNDLDALKSVNDSNEEGASADNSNVNNYDAEMISKVDDSDISFNEVEETQAKLTNEQLQNLCLEKDLLIKQLQEQLEDAKQSNNKSNELAERQSSLEKKLKQQQLESSRKENILIMRLTLKEQELQDCLVSVICFGLKLKWFFKLLLLWQQAQIEALKQLRLPTNTQLESYLLDPTLNFMFEQMKKEVDLAKSRAEEMQSELNAWKFTTDR